MQVAKAQLEQWMREHYFAAQFDIGSSGVENFRLGELRRLINLSLDDLDDVVFHDSQTLGGTGLRRAIADRFALGQLDRVMVTHGSTEANYLIHLALLSPGDEVIVMQPIYQQLAAIAQGLGAHCKTWQLREEFGFAPQLADLASQLSSRTKMVIVNFPHNPTGATLSLNDFHEFVSMVRSVNAWLVWDGAFSELVFEGTPLPDPTAFYEKAISMGTLSKAYGLPGLRVGWLIACPSVLEQCVIFRDYVSLHLSPFIEMIAEQVVKHGDTIIQNRLENARANLAYCKNWAAECSDIDWIPPRGGVCAFPKLLYVPDVDAFCRRLAVTDRVLTVPGSCFGFAQRIRLGFGGRRTELEGGLHRLSKALVESSPR